MVCSPGVIARQPGDRGHLRGALVDHVVLLARRDRSAFCFEQSMQGPWAPTIAPGAALTRRRHADRGRAVAEIGDSTGFKGIPSSWPALLGLCLRDHSSGQRRRQGSGHEARGPGTAQNVTREPALAYQQQAPSPPAPRTASQTTTPTRHAHRCPLDTDHPKSAPQEEQHDRDDRQRKQHRVHDRATGDRDDQQNDS